MEKELVSIAVCTYNGAEFLNEQLNSLVNQTYTNIEIIVIDDCSADNTVQILESYRQKYSFFSYTINDHNVGYVKNFEKVISQCKGEYIALSDQDDIWELNKIEKQVSYIGQAALIYHDSSFIDHKSNPLAGKLSEIYPNYFGNNPYPFLFYNCVSGHSMLFNKRIIPDLIPFDKRYFHDRWIAFIASERGGIYALKDCLVKYRQHLSSETDSLNIHRKTSNIPAKFFNPSTLEWLKKCSKSSLEYQSYINQILSCFNTNGTIINKLRLFILLSTKQHLLFYTVKKSFFSKMNFIRKICFLSKHS